MSRGRMSAGQRHRLPSYRRRAARAFLRKRDGEACWLCGERMLFQEDNLSGYIPAHDPRDATIDHVVERCNGGSNAYENLRLAHRECNNMRSNGHGCRPQIQEGAS